MRNSTNRDPIEELRREMKMWRWMRWVFLVGSISVVCLGQFYNQRMMKDVGQIAAAAHQDPSMALILEDVRAFEYARHSSNMALGGLALILVLLTWRRNSAMALLELSDRISKREPPD